MPTLIQIKRSDATDVPASLSNGELAFTTNGDILYIGGNDAIIPIAGERVPGVLTANQALVANATSEIDEIKVDTLTLNGTGMTSVNTVANSTVLGSDSNNELTSTWAAKTYIDAISASANPPGGADTQVQFNDGAGGFEGNTGFTFTDSSNTVAISNTISVGGQLLWTGDISPTALAADTNNYAPAGLDTCSTLRLSATGATRTVTGLTGGSDGRVLHLHNIGSEDIVLSDENVSSTAANRFALSADLTLSTDEVALLQYDSTDSRWRSVGIAGASLPQALDTGDSPQFLEIELGDASDTTLARSGAGVLSVEGVDVVSNTGVIQDLIQTGAVGGDSEFLVGTAAGAMTWEDAATALASMGAQAQDAVLDDLAALTAVADNEFIVGTGAGTYAHEDAATARGSMGAQAQDLVLDDLSALSEVADNEFIVGTGAGAYAHESGATARTSIGLGTADNPQFATIELGHASDTTIERVGSGGAISVEGDTVGMLATAQEWSAIQSDVISDAGNGTVVRPTIIGHNTSVAPAIGLGAGLQFNVEVADGEDLPMAYVDVVTTAVGAGAEAVDLVFSQAVGGAAPTESFRVLSTGAVRVQAAGIELGDDSDTTLTRSGAGVLAVEGVDVVSNSGNIQDLVQVGPVTDDSYFLVGTGAGALAWETTTTARDSIGLGTGDNVTFNDVTASGNLVVNGTLTTVDTTNLQVEDPLMKMARLNTSADSVDIGFYGVCDPTGAQDTYTGLFRDAGDDKYRLFHLLEEEPTTTVNIAGTNYAVATLVADLESDNVTITGGSIDCGTF